MIENGEEFPDEFRTESNREDPVDLTDKPTMYLIRSENLNNSVIQSCLDLDTNTLDIDKLMDQARHKDEPIDGSDMAEVGQEANNNASQTGGAQEEKFTFLNDEIQQTLIEKGFGSHEVDVIEELAQNYLQPMLDEMERERLQLELQSVFGGPQQWETMREQLRAWGQSHLDPSVFEVLSSSVDGIMAIRHMMTSNEPKILGSSSEEHSLDQEEKLYEMMRDPRYWRDHDEEFVSKVTNGFRQLYGN